jgi:hypothetical protein
MDIFGRKIEYTVVLGFGSTDLERKVNELAVQGWRPLGNRFSSGGKMAKYNSQQAMIRITKRQLAIRIKITNQAEAFLVSPFLI